MEFAAEIQGEFQGIRMLEVTLSEEVPMPEVTLSEEVPMLEVPVREGIRMLEVQLPEKVPIREGVRMLEVTLPEEAPKREGIRMVEVQLPEEVPVREGFRVLEVTLPEEIPMQDGIRVLEVPLPEEVPVREGFRVLEVTLPEEIPMQDGIRVLEVPLPEEAPVREGFGVLEVTLPEEVPIREGFRVLEVTLPEEVPMQEEIPLSEEVPMIETLRMVEVQIEEGRDSKSSFGSQEEEKREVEELEGNKVEYSASVPVGDSEVENEVLLLPSGPSAEDSQDIKETPAGAELYYLQVLGQYLQSVRTKESHESFLKDEVVGPFLSLCLATNSNKVLVGVLKVINVLVKNRENLPRLRELLHFTDALLAASRNENIHGTVRQKASAFYDLINNWNKHLCNNSGTLNGASLNSDCKKPFSSVRKTQIFVNHTLNKERRFVITRALVKINGVISIAFNPEQHLCIVRSRNIKSDDLGMAVANLGFECSLISRNENNEVIRLPIVSEIKVEKKENQEVPFYFPEDDDEVPVGENAVAVKGFSDNEDGAGWWTSAKKLVRKSLFW